MTKLKKKTFFHYTGKVHDLTVENSHTYNVEGKAVHNSAAGSLTAYVLGVTNLDPIEYDLSFERFLNPARQGAPDIDSDISDRDLLIELLRKNLGERNVIPISNYNTFRLKSLIKDIARFYSIPFDEVNAALAPVEDDVKKEVFKPGTDKNLFVLTYEDAIKYSKSLQDFIAAHPEVAEPIEILFKQNRSLGRHAGGVIVSQDIAERMPLILARGEAQTPWVEGMNYKHLEEFGWIKFDLLGLETLRIIERCIGLILERREGVKNPDFKQIKAWFDKHMDPKNIDLNDQKVYEYVYHEGRFAGIFQLTQTGAQRLFTKAKPRSIIDIATLTSIYRPGPLAANVDKLYIDAKNNPDKIDYQHPLIKKVLESTYGCLHGSTIITTEDGDVTIQKVVEEQLIGTKLPSFNEETCEIEQDEIVAAICTGTKETLTIELENGKSLRLTSDHRVYTTRGWVEAGDLTVEDEILGVE